jgi:hypothetical protein
MLNAASESFALSGYGFFSAKPTQAVRFGIEAKTVVVNDCQVPAWDIVLVTSSNREVVEVKSGEISRLDRHAIWRRLRRELSVGSGAVVRPLLVLSPEPADSHQKWSELSFFAVEWSGHAPAAPPQRVGDAKQLLEEALWWLCRAPDDKVGSPPINLQHAVTALSAFSVEFCSLEYLEAMVSDNIEALFPGGFSDQLCNLILGWLNERAVALRPESHLFTLKELLLEMGILQHCLSLAPGTLERWRTIWTEFPQLFQQRACMQFGETGVSVPMGKSQPAIAVRLSEAGDGGLILRGKAGAGKTAVIAQFRQQLEKECQEFFVCAADDVPEPDISDLMRSLRFRRALLRLHNPDGRFWIMIDALDETEGSVQKAWSQQLALLAANTGITVIVTAREFVSPNDRLIRSQFGTWKYVQTEDWPKELVCELVDRFVPGVHLTDKMLSLLVQPMMLDLFRRTFVEAGGALLHGQTGLKTYKC